MTSVHLADPQALFCHAFDSCLYQSPQEAWNSQIVLYTLIHTSRQLCETPNLSLSLTPPGPQVSGPCFPPYTKSLSDSASSWHVLFHPLALTKCWPPTHRMGSASSPPSFMLLGHALILRTTRGSLFSFLKCLLWSTHHQQPRELVIDSWGSRLPSPGSLQFPTTSRYHFWWFQHPWR